MELSDLPTPTQQCESFGHIYADEFHRRGEYQRECLRCGELLPTPAAASNAEIAGGDNQLGGASSGGAAATGQHHGRSGQRVPNTLFACRWCGKTRRPSEWEQKILGSDAYARLCRSCARRRLHNPWNALLALRKVAE